MPVINHTLVYTFTCSLCPATGSRSGTMGDIGQSPRLPEGWTWAVRPRPFLPDSHKSAVQLGSGSGESSEPLIYLCRTCTKRVEDATTPHPDKRKGL